MGMSEISPPIPGLVASVVVPAKDEELLVGGCIAALCHQRGVDPRAWEILLILDGCSDMTEARALSAAFGEVPIHAVSTGGLGAGGARSFGMDLACRRLEMASGRDGSLSISTYLVQSPRPSR